MRLIFSLLFISILLSGCAVVRPLNLPVSQQQPPDIHPKKPIRVMLVLGSGGVRGVAEAGVIKVLAGAGVPIDAIVGTSAGGVVGVLYASNPSPSDLAYEMIKAKRKQVVKFNIFNMNKGLISGYTLQRYLINHISTGLYFRNLKIPFGIMTTDFVTGRAHFINSGIIAPAINASSSVPGVFRVVSLYGHQFVDGGVSAPLGTQKARQFYKPKLLIAISIHVDLDPEVPSSMMDKIGRGVDVIETNLEREQFRYADIVIHPRVGDLGALSTGDNVHLYQQGIIAAKRKLPLILREMKRKGIKRVARR